MGAIRNPNCSGTRRRSRVGLGVVCGLALACAPALARPPPYLGLDHYGHADGLSQLTVTALVEDARGFLWVGTQEGLNRFDGHRFERQHTEAGSSIDALAVDARARLWVGTNDAGLEVLDLPAGTRRSLGVAGGLSHPTVREILVDPDGGAWLGTGAGIDRVDAEARTAAKLVATAPVVAMARAFDGQAFALDQACGLWRLQADGAERVRLADAIGSPCVTLVPSASGLWQVGAGGELVQVGAQGQVLQRTDVPASGAAVSAAALDVDGGLLLGLSDGRVLQVPPNGASVQTVALDRAIGSALTRMHRGRSGVLWLGTHTEGLFRVRALSGAVRRDLGSDGADEGWPGRSVRAIWHGPRQRLVGTDSGLAMQSGQGPWRTVAAIAATSVRDIVAAAGGGWWIGSHRGLWRLDENGGAAPVPGLPGAQVTDLLLEGDVLWVATRAGLVRYRDGVIDNAGVPDALDGQFLTALMRDAEGRLWIGSNERGIYRLAADGTLAHLTVAGGQLLHDSVWSLYEDASAWWIGTFSAGLQRIDKATGTSTTIGEHDGLSNGVVYRIEPDGHGRLWLSTNQGLSVVDGSGRVLQTLMPADGLRNREFNSGASFRDVAGLLHFGGTRGLDVIDPARLQLRAASAVPVIKALRVLGHRGAAPAAPGGRSIDTVHAQRVALEHRDSVVALELVAIDFPAPESARLRYRIDDILPDWVEPQGPHAEVMLSYLPAGTYLLEAAAAGRDGGFGEPRQLVLVMPPPPWQHPLAYVGYVLLGLALLGWLAWRVYARHLAERAQIELLNRTVAERTAELERANRLLRESNVQLDVATRTDPLTQVSNRRDLHEWLDREGPRIVGASAGGQPGGQLYFCMIDIDDFKRINDHYGHQVGDQVLVRFAQLLRSHCRQQDVIVRWGGEEFLLVVREARVEDATALIERIRDSVATTALDLPGGVRLSMTCSIGFAPWPLSPNWPTLSDWDLSVVLADRALYGAKTGGKDAWVGLVPGATPDRACLLALLAGADPAQLEDGCVEVLHSGAATPRFARG